MAGIRSQIDGGGPRPPELEPSSLLTKVHHAEAGAGGRKIMRQRPFFVRFPAPPAVGIGAAAAHRPVLDGQVGVRIDTRGFTIGGEKVEKIRVVLVLVVGAEREVA